MKGEGVSEVIGSLILIGVVVTGMIIVAILLFASPAPSKVPVFDAVISNRSKAIYIYHKGGDTLRQGSTRSSWTAGTRQPTSRL